MPNEPPSEPLFRATKRRKIIRGRADADEPDEANATTAHVADEDVTTITKHLPTNEENSHGGVTRVLKKAGPRKQGIGFSSASNWRSAGPDHNDEKAMVPASDEGLPDQVQNDRFVKPTGKVVTEDKHMYVARNIRLAVEWH